MTVAIAAVEVLFSVFAPVSKGDIEVYLRTHRNKVLR